ncbi:class D sortase [Halobacillus salinarum]|uniref:Class D sortase n=1 Tax=Halobacillus salinarum TaxID=2932257 RepID=A0ABY4EQK9_9BACI|nr:class D sortase [Halobacillus salinarum]UOQ45929.1 class D sortase [Halobacillus salinarum]
MKKVGIFVILLGLGIFLYYGFNWWQQRQAIQEMDNQELNEYLGYDDTYKKAIQLNTEEKSTSFQKGDRIGQLSVPEIEKKYPVFWGTDHETLKSGVGMYDSQWTVQPNQTGHVFLAGHRDTVFEEMGKLNIGDVVAVEFKGSTYIYQIRKLFVTEKDDRSVITKKDKSFLTISTCYPFQFVGDAPYRYIIQSELIDVKSK